MDIQPPSDVEDASEPARPEIDPGLLRSLEEPADELTDDAPETRDAAVEAGDAAEEALRAPVVPDGDGDGDADADEDPDGDGDPDGDEIVDAFEGVALTTRVEALLFAAPEALGVSRLKTLLGIDDGSEIRDALATLAKEYEATGRAFRVVEVAGGFQVRTREDLAPLVRRLRRKRAPDDRLSAAAMETLAIVAYRQPVLRADVEKIRGVACGEVLRALMERGLVRVAGRAELPGSPLLYGTTPHFLEVFGLRNLRDLPNSP